MNVYNLELAGKNEIRNQVLLINMMYFLFTVYMVFSLIFFFHNSDVCIFAKTTALILFINYIFMQDISIVFIVSMKFGDLAILKNNVTT